MAALIVSFGRDGERRVFLSLKINSEGELGGRRVDPISSINGAGLSEFDVPGICVPPTSTGVADRGET